MKVLITNNTLEELFFDGYVTFLSFSSRGPQEEQEMTYKEYDMSELQKLAKSFAVVSANFCLLAYICPTLC